jgi:Fe-S oxidoreductase
MSEPIIEIKTMSQLASEGRKPDYLFWVGCAGSYDPRAQKVSRALVKVMTAAGC